MMDVTLQQVVAFRTVWALNDLRKDRTLHATHCAICLGGGSQPVWGVFSMRTGRLMQLLGSRVQVEQQYPKKVWKRLQQQWHTGALIETLDAETRGRLLDAQIGGKPMPALPGTPSNVVQLKSA